MPKPKIKKHPYNNTTNTLGVEVSYPSGKSTGPYGCLVNANYMEQHGMFTWLGRLLPWLRFSPGKLFSSGKRPMQKLTAEKGAAYAK